MLWDIKLSCILLLCICRISEIEPKYYADGEDAYAMRRDLSEFKEKEKVGTWTLSPPHLFLLLPHPDIFLFFFSFFLLVDRVLKSSCILTISSFFFLVL